MTRIAAYAISLAGASKRAYERKWTFLAVSFAVFLTGASMLAIFNLLPSVRTVPTVVLVASPVVATSAVSAVSAEEPVRIEIAKIGLATTIANPTTTNIETLDTYLLKGAVRYPTSAKLGEKGNVVLFGHSSYLPIVGNQAYKTFNGIQKLVAGDTITVASDTTVYTYRVRTMEKESAASDAGISLITEGRVLTLATCNSFGAKSDRFIVTADFVESHAILI